MTNQAPHALILAAGVGRRLGEAAEPMPKALLPFGGRSLMARHIDALHQAGITDITVVVGFEAEKLRATLSGIQGVTLVTNPDYREGSVVSLWAARDTLTAGRPLVLMDADVLYEPAMLARLVRSAHANAFLLDRELEPGDEPVKLCVQDGRIVDFHKRPQAAHDWHGESVGFFRFTAATAADLARRADLYVTGGRRHMEYEEPIRDMVQADPALFGFEDITGMPWTEIDFPEDIVKANTLLPKLAA